MLEEQEYLEMLDQEENKDKKDRFIGFAFYEDEFKNESDYELQEFTIFKYALFNGEDGEVTKELIGQKKFSSDQLDNPELSAEEYKDELIKGGYRELTTLDDLDKVFASKTK